MIDFRALTEGKKYPDIHAASGPLETAVQRQKRRLAKRLEVHYAPEHGSWLNMAEIKQSVLA